MIQNQRQSSIPNSLRGLPEIALIPPINHDGKGNIQHFTHRPFQKETEQARRQAPPSPQQQALSNNPEMFPGKTHPNAAGTKLMAQTIRAALTKKQK
jgi:hypothetical protein